MWAECSYTVVERRLAFFMVWIYSAAAARDGNYLQDSIATRRASFHLQTDRLEVAKESLEASLQRKRKQVCVCASVDHTALQQTVGIHDQASTCASTCHGGQFRITGQIDYTERLARFLPEPYNSEFLRREMTPAHVAVRYMSDTQACECTDVAKTLDKFEALTDDSEKPLYFPNPTSNCFQHCDDACSSKKSMFRQRRLFHGVCVMEQQFSSLCTKGMHLPLARTRWEHHHVAPDCESSDKCTELHAVLDTDLEVGKRVTGRCNRIVRYPDLFKSWWNIAWDPADCEQAGMLIGDITLRCVEMDFGSQPA